MRSVIGTVEVGHAIQAGVGCGATLAAMGVELLLGENVAATLKPACCALVLLFSCEDAQW